MPVVGDQLRCPHTEPSAGSAGALRRAGWLVTVLLILGGLSPATVRAQEWHELYADGQQALRNGQLGRAADLLRRAIQKRPQPGVSVPTYGTNFEPRYFPYLRLAEVYLRLEAYDDAQKVLATSARLAVEPAADRAALEARLATALEAKRPPPVPVQLPAEPVSPPKAGPPIAPAESTLRSIVPPAAPPPAAVAPAPAPATASTPPRVSDPVRRGSPVLEITSAPAGAQVFVDDAPVGRTDPETGRLRLTSLNAGRHRVRLAFDGRDDLVREVDLAGETVAFHGALSVREPVAPATGSPGVSAGSWPLFRPWLIGGVLLLLVAGSAWFWRNPRAAPAAAATKTPSHPAGVSGSGSYEDFPIQFGEYLLLRRIGKGGMATVYEAERRGERFALKRPLAGFLDDPRFLERFIREADLGRALHHPNIVRIHDRGQVGEIPYFAMELIDGETLRDRVDRDGRLDPAFASQVTAQVAEALDYAHHKGVIHRDLKPSNIMLPRSGGLKVMDYGIARAQHLEGVTTTGGFLGTPHYAAPEAADARTEPRSDLYSLGVVFFEMLTGQPPFRGDNAFAIIHSHIVTPPPTPSSLNYAVPEALDRIVLQLLAKEPAERPTAEALLNQLADYLEGAR